MVFKTGHCAQTNFLAETIESLEENGKTPLDVLWIGTSFCFMTWEEFCANADFLYDSGYGSAEINEDLVIVGFDWWLERDEYDGLEWWAFKRIPDKPSDKEANVLSIILA